MFIRAYIPHFVFVWANSFSDKYLKKENEVVCECAQIIRHPRYAEIYDPLKLRPQKCKVHPKTYISMCCEAHHLLGGRLNKLHLYRESVVRAFLRPYFVNFEIGTLTREYLSEIDNFLAYTELEMRWYYRNVFQCQPDYEHAGWEEMLMRKASGLQLKNFTTDRELIDYWFNERRIMETSKPNPRDLAYLDYVKKDPVHIREWNYLDSVGLLHTERNLGARDIFFEISDMYVIARYSNARINLTMGELVWA